MNSVIHEPVLGAGELESFARDGFLVVPGMFSTARMAEIARWTDEIVSWPETPGKHMVYHEASLLEPDRRVLSRIENFCPYHDGFDALLAGGPVLQGVSDLFGEPAVLFKEKINFKEPGGDGFKPHQDVQAGWSDYASLHITMLLSIDDATEENGCLELAPGRHKEGLLGKMWEPLTDSGIEYRAYPTRSGDVVFFDSFVPHRSGPNLSARKRRVLYVTYNRLADGDQRTRYFAEKRLSYPPDCEREPGKQYRFKV